MDPRLRTLLRQGDRAARLGKTQAAEEVYRQAVDQFPDSAQAWLGLSQVAPTEEERAASYQRALGIDPGLAAGASPRDELAPAEVVESPSNQLDAALAKSDRWLQQSTAGPGKLQDEPLVQMPSPAEAIPAAEEQALTCFYHPNRETILRCNRCAKPICTRCAVKTPVGYRCKECVKEQQDVFYSALWYDYVLAAVVALSLSLLGAYIVPGIGWLTIIIAPFAGMAIAEGARLVVRRRRGRWLPHLVGACILVGSLPIVGVSILGVFLYPASFWPLLWQIVYLALSVSSAYYRLR